MTVHGPGGESVATKTITVRPRYAQPIVSCEASKLSRTAPLTVEFTSGITGDYKSLRWTFGDGESSSDSNPRHTFATAADYNASLIVSPMDGTQPDTEQKIVIKVTKPWPVWAKVICGGNPMLNPPRKCGWPDSSTPSQGARLPVYYWAEQTPVCQTILLTKADETVELSPAAPLRIRRDGKSQNLIVQPLQGADPVRYKWPRSLETEHRGWHMRDG